MNKILIVTEVFYPENGLVNDFAEELVKRGFSVDILTQHPSYPYGKVFDGYKNDDYSLDQWNGIKIHRFKVIEGYKESKLKKILNYRAFVTLGGKIAKRIGGDYDHILVYQTGPLTLALPAVAIKKKFRTPLTVWTFDIWPDAVYAYGFPRVFPLNNFLSSIIKKVYANADNILVSSKMFSQTINQYVPNRAIDYAPNWLIEEPQKESSVKLNQEKFNFTFTGNVSKAQNLDNVIAGWKLANVQDIANLNIVGDGSYLANLERADGVVFHGRVPSSEVQDILRQSNALILSLVADEGISKTEPFKLQSYLKSGKPIFGVVGGAAREIIEENSLGVCANPSEVNDIAQKFKSSIEFAKNNDISAKALELSNTRFNREKIIDRVISYITK